MKIYKKKPVKVEAVQFTGTNQEEIREWSNYEVYPTGTKLPENERTLEMVVSTLEGLVKAKIGDYIIKGIRGEFYPCEKSIFEESYYEVTEEDGFTYKG